LLSEADIGPIGRIDHSVSLQVRPGEDLEATETVLVQILDRIEEIGV
jgi:hypothetical protein